MNKLQNVSLSVTGKINSVADGLARIVLISNAEIRKRFENPNNLIPDWVDLNKFYMDEETGILPQMNDSFVYEEGTYQEKPSQLYELFTKIGTITKVDGDLVTLSINSDISKHLYEKIHETSSEDESKKNIKQLHVSNIRGEVTEGQEVLFTAYKITTKDGQSAEGIDYVFLTDRERHFKKDK